MAQSRFSVFFAALAITTTAPSPVDLHAHLFFEEGVGMSFLRPIFGGFTLPIPAVDWKERFRSKVNAEALEGSGASLVIAALYANPFFAGSQRDQIRRQIAEAQDFVHGHPDWAIPHDLSQALAARAQGKRLLLLSLEGASGVLENDADIREFVEKDGLTVVTLLHFARDEIGGPALLPGIRALITPSSWWGAKRDAQAPEEERVLLNPYGLTEKGRWLAEQLLAHGVWIDLSHASDASQRDLLPILDRFHQPPLYTHTALRESYHAERGVSQAQLKEASSREGIVGILPSQDMMKGTRIDPAFCTGSDCSACEGGLAAVLSQFRRAAAVLGAEHVSLGSDIDAPINFLPPGCGIQGEHGLFQYGQLPLLWEKIRASGPSLTTEKFLELWARFSKY